MREIDRVVDTDVVIVGGGIAGLTATLGLASKHVTLVTKNSLGKGSSSYLAQGGVAAALGSDDSPEMHAHDTCSVGSGLSDVEVVDLAWRVAIVERRDDKAGFEASDVEDQ